VPLVLLLLVLLVPHTVAGLGAASNRYAVVAAQRVLSWP